MSAKAPDWTLSSHQIRTFNIDVQKIVIRTTFEWKKLMTLGKTTTMSYAIGYFSEYHFWTDNRRRRSICTIDNSFRLNKPIVYYQNDSMIEFAKIFGTSFINRTACTNYRKKRTFAICCRLHNKNSISTKSTI